MSDEAAISEMLNVVRRLDDAGDRWGAWADDIAVIALCRWT
jgi:hypothetical protein